MSIQRLITLNHLCELQTIQRLIILALYERHQQSAGFSLSRKRSDFL